MHAFAIWAIVGVSLLLMLTRPRGVAESWWISAGAVLLVVGRLIAPSAALHAVRKGTDVFAFLSGMMLLSELAREHGVFDWVSSVAVRRARGSSARLFATVYGIAVLVTTFLSNDATAVVLTPAILVAVRKAKVEPLPHLYACALVANAASFVLPISNPANLVVFDGAMPSLGRWLGAFAVASVFSIGTTYLALRWLFRAELTGSFGGANDAPAPLAPRGRGVLAGLALTAAVLLLASTVRVDLGLPTLVCALGMIAVASLATRTRPTRLFARVSWGTLVLVAGLFVMVEAVQTVGAAGAASRALGAASRHGIGGAVVSAFVVGVTNNVVNNLPLGLVAGATVAQAHPPALLVHAVVLGVDLGPNLAVTGSLATILWLIALRKERIRIGFLDFLRVGIVAMPAALGMAILGLLLSRLWN